jgi:hypothetical protein
MALGLQVDQRIEIEQIMKMLETKISDLTRFDPLVKWYLCLISS